MSKIIIERMRNGDREAIMKGLSCQGAIYRMDAIAFASLNNMNDTEIVEKLMQPFSLMQLLEFYQSSSSSLRRRSSSSSSSRRYSLSSQL